MNVSEITTKEHGETQEGWTPQTKQKEREREREEGGRGSNDKGRTWSNELRGQK